MVTFNVKKTVFINFSLKKKQIGNIPKLKFNNSMVELVHEHKHLGIIFSEDMKWSKHIAKITSKANQRLGALYRQSRKMTRLQLETIYLSMIRPILEYGSVLFSNCSFSDVNLIESVQRRAAVLSTGAIRRTETVRLFAETGWDSLELRRRAKMFLFFKIVKESTPPYLSNIISQRAQQIRSSRSSTKNSILLIEPTCRITCYKTSFFPDCIRIWNSLSNEFVNCASIDMFKAGLVLLPAFSSKTHVVDTVCFNKVLTGNHGRLITQFRLGLSPLRNDLFCYTIIDNPFCPACGECLETLSHYLFECPSYLPHRLIMFNNIQVLVAELNLYFGLRIDVNNRDAVTSLLTRGIHLPEQEESVQLNINRAIFNICSNFITKTLRFKSQY
jgi:hypothetical protein